ncbi:acetyltransferase, GNAT family [Gloeophyllum trabeum ATCC 11539]|uniref:Acetyltransferase, GNAT family n=1 Tax=Gloeophyllum trabeum (strain ATCC 11539 / FP-39264 / Madison 617) TaxID=670483 RepID=S7QLN5_GLOTA|nr:acetyltransferase, GNAT family [Gloeophyllum trabeum ATCC 11539]EPQ60328.1 acetyltransferase, GNAT family [Gloeophyllum trabeum ATCC 11539]
MSSSQLHPLQVNVETGEPYLRLPAPHQNVIITPIRFADEAAIVQYMNDPRVYENLSSIPQPYTRENAQEWVKRVKARSDELLQELKRSDEHADRRAKALDGCPVMTIREVQEDGQDIFIGDLSVLRSAFVEVADPEERARLSRENKARAVGDPEIVFTMGDYLIPSHHGRGIMTAAVRTLMNEWMIPRMNCHKILVNAKKGNLASRRVFEKAGFRFMDTVEDALELTVPGRAGKWSLDVLEWKYERL